jgi:hypothetical protein
MRRTNFYFFISMLVIVAASCITFSVGNDGTIGTSFWNIEDKLLFPCIFGKTDIDFLQIGNQDVIQFPTETQPSEPQSPRPTHAPLPPVNCTEFTNCADCTKKGDCGWCNVGEPQCIASFNVMNPQGSGLTVCYGNSDQYFWMQCTYHLG